MKKTKHEFGEDQSLVTGVFTNADELIQHLRQVRLRDDAGLYGYRVRENQTHTELQKRLVGGGGETGESRKLEKEIDRIRERSLHEWHSLKGIYSAIRCHDARKAREHHEEAIKMAPDGDSRLMAVNNYAVTMLKMHCYLEAMEAARQHHESVPGDLEVLAMYIVAAARSYHLQLADTLLDKWSEHNPESSLGDAAWIRKAAHYGREAGLNDEQTSALAEAIEPLLQNRRELSEPRYRIMRHEGASWLDVIYSTNCTPRDVVELNWELAEKVAAAVAPEVMSFIVVRFSSGD